MSKTITKHHPKKSDKRRRFDAQSKQEAVTLGKRIGIGQAAQDLDVGESNLRSWTQSVAVHGSQAFAPLAVRTNVDAELRRLREENRILKMERDILKTCGSGGLSLTQQTPTSPVVSDRRGFLTPAQETWLNSRAFTVVCGAGQIARNPRLASWVSCLVAGAGFEPATSRL